MGQRITNIFQRPLSCYWRSWHWVGADFSTALTELRAKWIDGEILWQTRHKSVRRVKLEAYEREAVWKIYYEKRFFRYFFRPSLAARELVGYELARRAGLPVARALACGETRRGVRLLSCFVVTAMETGTRDGDDFMPEGVAREDVGRRTDFCRQNLALLARLHAAGLVHGGFHPRNELYRIGTDGAMEIIWIDLATCRRGGRAGQKADVDFFFDRLALPAAEEQELRAHYCAAHRSFVQASCMIA